MKTDKYFAIINCNKQKTLPLFQSFVGGFSTSVGASATSVGTFPTNVGASATSVGDFPTSVGAFATSVGSFPTSVDLSPTLYF